MKQTFFIGYPLGNGFTDLKEYTSAQEADFNTDEWVKVEADTLEQAFVKYEVAREAYEKAQQSINKALAIS